MKNGLKLGTLFVIQASAMLLYRQGAVSSLIFLISFIAIPIYHAVLGIRYREKNLGGFISYRHAVGYLLAIYIFALILGTIAYIVIFYILFNDPYFIEMMEQSVVMMEEILGDSAKGIDLAEEMRGLTPKLIASQYMTTALFFGIIYIYIISIFIRKSKKNEWYGDV